jgi:DNA-binding NarL/FixJ family response regulator
LCIRDWGKPGRGAADAAASSPDRGALLRDVLGLSSREMEVLALVAAGLSNGEIAARLFITRKTAAVHVTHILDKLGVGNRVEAAVVAERAGLRA